MPLQTLIIRTIAVASLIVATAACTGESPRPDEQEMWPGRGPAVATPDSVRVDASPPAGAPPARGHDTIAVRSTEFTRGDLLLYRPNSIAVVGEYILVSDATADTLVTAFDRTTGNVVRRVGRRGQGPTELMDPRWFSASTESATQFWTYDFSLRRLALYDLAKPAREEFVRSRNLNNGVSLMGAVLVRDEIWSNGLFDDSSIIILDADGKGKRQLSLSPPFDSTRMPARVGRRLLNRTFMAASPSGARIALLYQWKNRADLVETASGRAVSTRGPKDTPVEYYLREDRFFIRDTVSLMAYTSATATERSVFGVHCACSSFESAGPLEVHQWTWDGALRRVLQLDVKPIAIAAGDRGDLYLLLHDPEPRIVKATIPPER